MLVESIGGETAARMAMILAFTLLSPRVFPNVIPGTVLGQLGDRVRHALRAFFLPPASGIGPIIDDERKRIIEASAIFGHREKTIDRESAYEKLKSRAIEKVGTREAATPQSAGIAGDTLGSLGDIRGVLGSILGGGKKR